MSRNSGIMIGAAALLLAGAVVGVLTIGGDEAGTGAEPREMAGGKPGKGRGESGAKATKRGARPTRSHGDREEAPVRVARGTVSTLSSTEAIQQAGIWINDALQTNDAEKRVAAIEAVRAALHGGHDEASAYAALRAYVGIQQKVEFLDRGAFRDLVAPYLDAEDPGMRRTAWYAFLQTDLQPGDRELLRALASDPAPELQKSATHLMFLMEDGDFRGETGKLVLKMLESDDKHVRTESLRRMEGAQLSEPLEARVIELSRSADPVEVQTAIQYALGTIKDKSPAVVGRLVELMADPSAPKNAGAAAQGLRLGVPETSQAAVADAALSVLEEGDGKVMWGHGIDLLGRYGTEQHRTRVEMLLDDQSLDDTARRSLQVVLRRLK